MDIKYKNMSGVYKLTHQKRGIFYIGSAVCLYSRLHAHYSNLKKGVHDNKILQAVYNRHGRENLIWDILEICDSQKVIEREQFYIDQLNPEMNICRYAQNSKGYKHTEESKRKFSASRKGNKNSLGRKLSEETKQKIATKAKERGISETCIKAAKRSNTGRVHTKESVEKRAKKQLKLSIEQVQKIRLLLANGEYQYRIAKAFGVSQRVINKIHNNVGCYGDTEYSSNPLFLSSAEKEKI
jgi:group I intron endonuclease